MASLLPILKDIVPMISPGEVSVTKAAEVQDASTGQTGGMTRKAAIVGKSTRLCASVMTAEPYTSSAVHHHGEQDTIVYALAGRGGAILSRPDPSAPPIKQVLEPGDFALIPAYAEHQEVNNGEEMITWVITRSGKEPVVVNLSGWGGREV